MTSDPAAAEARKHVVEVDVGCLSAHACAVESPSPRDGFAEIASSVGEDGVLEPILVCSNDGDLAVIDGCRRLEAAEAAGIRKIPAIVLFDVHREEAGLLRSIGNTFSQRERSTMERVSAVGRGHACLLEVMRRNPSLYGDKRAPVIKYLTGIVHISRSLTMYYVQMDKDLIEEFKSMVDEGLLPDRQAAALCRLPEARQRAIAAYIASKGISDRVGVAKAISLGDDPEARLECIERDLDGISEILRLSGTTLSPEGVRSLQNVIASAADALAARKL